ncbi:MAG TPA: sensor histidine kinase, partial [Anaerolineae bacterium]|nr:sensor histidine kinase [Anaerolineae bacterium]
AERLLRTAIRHTAAPDQQIAYAVEGDDLLLASKQATALALVLGELFNNALLHGLVGRRRGRVEVHIHRGEAEVRLIVRDDGIGLPPDFDWERHERLGLRIVRTLVRRELNGAVAFQSDGGAKVTITWPLPASTEEVS